MYTYIYIYMYAYMYMYMFTYTYTYTYMQMYVYIYIYVHVSAYVYVHVLGEKPRCSQRRPAQVAYESTGEILQIPFRRIHLSDEDSMFCSSLARCTEGLCVCVGFAIFGPWSDHSLSEPECLEGLRSHLEVCGFRVGRFHD